MFPIIDMGGIKSNQEEAVSPRSTYGKLSHSSPECLRYSMHYRLKLDGSMWKGPQLAHPTSDFFTQPPKQKEIIYNLIG